MERKEDRLEKDVREDAAEHAAVDGSVNTQVAEKKSEIVISKKMFAAIAVIVIVLALGYALRGVFIAATVNGSPISRLSVIRTLEKTSGKQALEGLIMQKVIADEVRNKGITVSDAEVALETQRITDQLAQQNMTLEAALASQGVTLDAFKQSERTQIQVEKLLGDKVSVTDAEVAQYITDNKLNIPAGQMATATEEISAELKREKVSKEGQALVDSLRAAAKVSYFVQY